MRATPNHLRNSGKAALQRVGADRDRRSLRHGFIVGRSARTSGAVIFAVATEEQTLHVFPGEAEAAAYCEGLDVEAAIWLFWDDAGVPLEPEFIVPNKRGLFSTKNGTYRLVKAAPNHHAGLLEALEHIRYVDGQAPFDSVVAIRRHLTAGS